MMKESILKIVPVFGSVILFLAWALQQTMLEQANGTLERIYHAENVYQTYQSNNALFNAIIAGADKKSGAEYIRKVQIYNYELGLREMESVLDNDERKNIPSALNPFSGTPDAETMTRITQNRLEKIQGKLMDKKNKIIDRKAGLNMMFLTLYAAGSVIILGGNILGTVNLSKSRLPTESH
jgi:hypothetical protein